MNDQIHPLMGGVYLGVFVWFSEGDALPAVPCSTELEIPIGADLL
jgi:hypothetical protein